MEKETLYELLKDYEDPCGKIAKGVKKTEHQWMARFALLNPNDCKIKTDWFKMVNIDEKPILIELSEEVKTYRVNLECPKCKEGQMISGESVAPKLDGHNIEFYHICNSPNCSNFLYLEKKYPYIKCV